MKCKKCGKEMFVALSCRQRCSCPSCHQKRTLILAYHLNENVLEKVSHRQYVFTIPKRLRLFFKYDRKLLGKLSKAAWETIRDVLVEVTGIEDAIPAMIAGIQTFGDLINAHSHIHALVPDGIFLDSGTFVKVDTIPMDKVLQIWENKVFEFLLKEKKISLDVVDTIRSWKHSGFSVNNDVQIKADDKKGMQRIIEYIA